jgi:hypothetical protein
MDKISLECGSLCSKTHDGLSPFRKIPVDQLATFRQISLKEHLSTKAPLLLSLFSPTVSHSDHRNKEKADSAHYPSICMATAILLKERNREMCGIQSLISTLLYNSHADKHVHACLNTKYLLQVYARLNHVGVSLSYTGTLNLMDDVGRLHTAPLSQ